MTTGNTLAAAEQRQIKSQLPIPAAGEVTLQTSMPEFEAVRMYLSDKPLHQVNRTRPIRQVTNAELKRIAAKYPPPPEWFEGEEECPF
ncbi:MAG: hypothetical protein HYS13_18710 [Planctomycetia bacterium]|nr:hypothetical protein [Planctomycetia bacterium]